VFPHHGNAAGGGYDDGFRGTELLDEAWEKRQGLLLVAGVVVHLAAAGLSRWKLDGVAQSFEHAHNGFTCFREEGVVITGDEEGNAQGRLRWLEKTFPASSRVYFHACGHRGYLIVVRLAKTGRWVVSG
jgi:hypothetical protein